MNPRRRVSIGKFLKIHLGYFFFKLLTAWVKRLPIASLSSYGGKIGFLTFYFLRGWRRVALNNLNLAFGREKNKDEIQRMCRELFKNMPTDMMEVYRCPGFEDSYFKTLVRFEGKEHLDRALKEGKGAIAVSAHLGNFPLMAARLTNEGYPLSLVVRDPENPKIARATLSIRDAVGIESIPDEPRMACVSRCFKALKEKRVLLLQIDQNAPVTEAWVDFFGYLVPTFKGPVLFSIRTGAPIIPMFITRDSDHLHKITVHPFFDLKTTGNVDQDITSNLARLTKIIEEAIREHPEQWLWIYRRFKRARDVQTGERLFRKSS
ncbi:MAG TPA: lysophospholipid acyltransferase family protein [Thermodesulfobacteriota bacterium]|nr:lysophospholipid acyltransferase family protein [Thermodesulfobacteriota bacterium]